MSHLRGVKKEWEEESWKRGREGGRERQSARPVRVFSEYINIFNANFLSIIVPYLDTFAFINRLPLWALPARVGGVGAWRCQST